MQPNPSSPGVKGGRAGAHARAGQGRRASIADRPRARASCFMEANAKRPMTSPRREPHGGHAGRRSRFGDAEQQPRCVAREAHTPPPLARPASPSRIGHEPSAIGSWQRGNAQSHLRSADAHIRRARLACAARSPPHTRGATASLCVTGGSTGNIHSKNTAPAPWAPRLAATHAATRCRWPMAMRSHVRSCVVRARSRARTEEQAGRINRGIAKFESKQHF